jgi:hypothetical protein
MRVALFAGFALSSRVTDKGKESNMKLSEFHMADVHDPDHGVQIEYDTDRQVLYVHVDGMTVLRIQEINVDVTLEVDRKTSVLNPSE